MRCASCQYEVSARVRFCERCGAPVGSICRACGAAVGPEARFCASCGVATATGSEVLETADVTDAVERRQVTIMFCDLVDSTGLSGRIDPEELRDVIRGYYDICAREISRTGGYLARYIGDGVLAYFGYPVAHEQDAQAAVLAGLAVVEAMRAGRREPAVRVGIHSGLVVAGGGVGAGDRRELLVIGSTPNIAARVQSVARPNRVVISEATYGLVRGFFDCVDLGEQVIKGVDTPLRIWEVRGETGAQSRPEAAPKGGLTPLVGREREIATLLDCWQQSVRGHGRIVLVSGDAGLGKSRLVHELKTQLAGKEYVRLECRCSPHNESSPLFPIINLLQRVWGLRRADAAKDRLARIEDAARQSAPGVPEAVPLLAALLSVSLPDSYPALELTPQARKTRTLALLVRLICAMAERQPILLVVEDLQWIDPSTLEWLRLVMERVPETSIMALLLFRPTFGSPWSEGKSVVRIDIPRLGTEETAIMVRLVAGACTLPAEIVQALCARVDGVPLFVEELTKSVIQSGTRREVSGGYTLVGAMAAPAVPMSLADSLMARLDRLAPIREVVQLGATIGRAFGWELMLDVSGLDERRLQHDLARLVDAEVLYMRETTPKPTYVFKHALIQDAAYESVPRARRARYHLRIAQRGCDVLSPCGSAGVRAFCLCRGDEPSATGARRSRGHRRRDAALAKRAGAPARPGRRARRHARILQSRGRGSLRTSTEALRSGGGSRKTALCGAERPPAVPPVPSRAGDEHRAHPATPRASA
jgi:class 3 adenylate cyclase